MSLCLSAPGYIYLCVSVSGWGFSYLQLWDDLRHQPRSRLRSYFPEDKISKLHFHPLFWLCTCYAFIGTYWYFSRVGTYSAFLLDEQQQSAGLRILSSFNVWWIYVIIMISDVMFSLIIKHFDHLILADYLSVHLLKKEVVFCFELW